MKRIVSAAMVFAALIIAACAANGTPEKPSTTGTVTEGNVFSNYHVFIFLKRYT